MGDAALFLEDEESRQHEKKSKTKPMELDEYLDDMKGTSCFQGGLIMASVWLIFGSCTVTTLPIFLSGTPEFRCAFPYLEDAGSSNTTEAIISKLVPKTTNEDFNSCHRYVLNATSCGENSTATCVKNVSLSARPTTVSCNEYHYDDSMYKSSITTEWNLVCDRIIFKAIANSCMFFGFFLGSFLTGVAADWFGRKKIMLGTALMSAGFGFAVAFAPTYFFYLVFFTLFSGASIGEYIVAYSYLSEISNRKQRRDILLVSSLLGSFGDVVISPVAYIFRDWRYIALFCAVVPLFYLPVHYFMTESPRWLLSTGKEKAARKVVKRYFDSKGAKFCEDRWERVLQAERLKTQEMKRRKKYSVVDLFRTPHVRLVSLNIMFTWFVVSIVYYGLILNIGNLAGDPYMNGFINSLLDIVASVFMLVAMRLLAKNYLLCGSFLLAGIACISSMLVLHFGHPIASVVLACVGRFGAACAYKIAYVLTTEIFPTVVRTIGLSLGSGSSRIGGMISPFTVQAQESIPWLMQTIFGTLSIIAGILGLAFPDTNNVGLMSTLEEAEDFCAENMPRICRRKNADMRRRFTSPFLTSDYQQGKAEDLTTDDPLEEML